MHGSPRVFEAAAAAGAGALVHASSVGAYSPGPKDRRVDESWPTEGIPSSFYSRHKAACERALDELESRDPQLRVARLRPPWSSSARPRRRSDGCSRARCCRRRCCGRR